MVFASRAAGAEETPGDALCANPGSSCRPNIKKLKV
jgi:hypothetical protein